MKPQTKILSILLIYSNFLFELNAQNIYKDGWIDLNKNGRKDIYEDSSQAIDKRIEDLLSQMSIEEKTCQMAALYGYGRVLKDSLPTPAWKDAIWKDGIANIDEHLNGVGNPEIKNDYVSAESEKYNIPVISNIKRHVEAMNLVQKFFIEDTRLGIPADLTTECVGGVNAWGTTNFPMPIGLGCTWNKELIRKIGEVSGKEGRALGYTNLYAPLLDVVRDQRWGRVEENYGEEPYLVSQMGVAMVKGLQKDYMVASTAKTYVFYSASYAARSGAARNDPQIPFREAKTLLLAPFKAVCKAGVLGIMPSYNDYDGVPIIGSYYWMTEVLRNECGFIGYTNSDSGALENLFIKHKVIKDREDAVAMAVNAGLNVRTNFTKPEDMIIPLRKCIENGKVSIKTVDDRVRDVLRVKFMTGLFDKPYVSDGNASVNTINNPEHKALAKQAALESIVLLKNENNSLPLSKKIKSIAIIGPNADDESYCHGRYGPQGVKGTTVLEGIINKLGKSVIINYAKGCELIDKNFPENEVFPEPPSELDMKMINDAIKAAKKSDVVIMVMGGSLSTSGEAKSRSDLNLTGYQNLLIQKIHETGKKVILVLINSQPITINWPDKFIPAILEAWYPGQFGGDVIADVLFGDYNPGGKLTITFPRSVGQIPLNFPSKPMAQSDINDPIRLKGKLYPFGFGLSYTTFEYSNLRILPKKQNCEGTTSVTIDVKNTGKYEGDEVVQLYTNQEISSVTAYEKLLNGFERIKLKPNEIKQVTFNLTPSELAILNAENRWVVEPGRFKVMIGASSEDIRLTGTFELIK